MSFLLSLCFLFNKSREEEGRTFSAKKQRWRVEGGGVVAQTMYTHVSKYKNNKLKKKK
jgi:hypothetical protein